MLQQLKEVQQQLQQLYQYLTKRFTMEDLSLLITWIHSLMIMMDIHLTIPLLNNLTILLLSHLITLLLNHQSFLQEKLSHG